jgi:hypothetical protein
VLALKRRGHDGDNVAKRGVIWREVFRRLPAFLSMTDALPFERILLLPPLIQLSLHGLQGVLDVLLRRWRGLRGGCWCWSSWRRDDLLLWQRAGDLTLEQSEIPLSLSDVEVDGVWSGMCRRRALLLERLRLRRRRPHLLLLLGRCGLARDESPYPS